MSKKQHIKNKIYELTALPVSPKHRKAITHTLQFLIGFVAGAIALTFIGFLLVLAYQKKYDGRIFPGVSQSGKQIGGLTPDEVKAVWQDENTRFKDLTFTFAYEDKIATLSATDLSLGFDATTSADQAYSVGRSGGPLSNIYYQYLTYTTGIDLDPIFSAKTGVLDETIANLAAQINIPAQNALFDFQGGRVKAFKPAIPGRAINQKQLNTEFATILERIKKDQVQNKNLVFNLPVETVEPSVGNEEVNNLGIKELIGRGESTYLGSIPGRQHNVQLAAARINGVLIAPGETFSFNAALGDVTAATGYKQAYVIKNGRTVLDDGGGVCQVSTTLFRAALNSGLPVVERHAHSYRVGYYEQGGWKPGFDATVFAPSYDLKIKNDTAHHVLIQTVSDPVNLKLAFEMYGTKDGRVAEVSPVRLWDARPAPPTIYQDDPTLPNGVLKQVDWSNPGIKAAFDYKVTRNGEELYKETYFSNFVPWQAVFLRGTRV